MNTLTLSCLFGDNVVSATYLNSTAIMCYSPSLYSTGNSTSPVIVSVSNNGIDFSANNRLRFYYYPAGELISLSPTVGVLNSSDLLMITGTNLQGLKDATCQFVNFQFTYVSEGSIYSDSRLTCNTPSDLPSGCFNLLVTFSNHYTPQVNNFSYCIFPIPPIQSVYPTSGSISFISYWTICVT
jgi:hypothetical protein